MDKIEKETTIKKKKETVKKELNKTPKIKKEANKTKKVKKEKKVKVSKTTAPKKEKKKIDFKKLYIDFGILLKTTRFKVITLAVVSLVIMSQLIYLGVCINMNIKYAKYTKQMEVLGFAKLYDTGHATAHERVTKAEVAKLLLSAIYNVDDITDFAYEPEFEDKNALWVTYFLKEGIATNEEINKNNLNDSISYIEVLKYFTKARETLLKEYTDITAITLNYKDAILLKDEYKYYIADAIASELIPNDNSFNINDKMIKGELNKLIVNFVSKYNTITPGNNKVETETSKYPKNAADYPYIAEGIEKEVYEIPFYFREDSATYTPASLYKHRKEFFEQASDRLIKYYESVLNIDYKTINVEDFETLINDNLQYYNENSEYEEYVKYVKDHKLVLKGNIKPLLPIIYVDGTHYRVRCKLEFEIVEGNTKTSLIFGDKRQSDGVTYTKDKYSIYVDLPMETSLTSKTMYPITSPIINNISGSVNSKIISSM